MAAAPPLPDLDRIAALGRVALKEEPATLVELLGHGADAVVRKVYRNRGLRLLQTFGRRARAVREFANLSAVAAAGLPCTPPLGCSERRRAGFVLESTLLTRFLPETRPLKAVFQDLPPATAWPQRRRLLDEFARLLRRLHRAGIVWCTPMPRNLLLQGAPADGRLALCDLQTALHYRGAAPQRAALLDLFDAAFSPSRQRDFSRAERWRFLRSYCDGDLARARRSWRQLRRRSVAGHRLRKNLVMACRTYILAPWRTLRRPALPPDRRPASDRAEPR